MEDHVLLRVPPELQLRLDRNLSASGPKEEVFYEKESGRNYIFAIGSDRYYAVLKDLPTIIESLKSLEDVSYYKVADIGQILEVSSVRIMPGSIRPAFDEIDNSGYERNLSQPRKPNDFELDHGLTPPTANIKQRLSKSDEMAGIDPKDIKKFDSLLVELEAEVTKRERSGEEAHKPYEFQELIDEEPFMEYWDETMKLNQGRDNFLSSAKKAYEIAYDRYLQKNPHLDDRQKKVSAQPGIQKEINQENNVGKLGELARDFDDLLDDNENEESSNHSEAQGDYGDAASNGDDNLSVGSG